MSVPATLKYTSEHEWVLTQNPKSVIVGVTAYAVEQLGDIVHVDLPKVGEEFKAGAPFGVIESTKTVSDLYCPVAGKVIEVNEELKSKLETLSSDPYDQGWLIKITAQDEKQFSQLLSAADYEKLIG